MPDLLPAPGGNNRSITAWPNSRKKSTHEILRTQIFRQLRKRRSHVDEVAAYIILSAGGYGKAQHSLQYTVTCSAPIPYNTRDIAKVYPRNKDRKTMATRSSWPTRDSAYPYPIYLRSVCGTSHDGSEAP
ncbi:uncharacterized protein H6S33_000281 [Morchella sextelata]|uniref:uncharacterized protein n=1 Tax=Morchella sextelata TaxID=1174677 RepID=UPI001D05B110|nr:uncharacterized protein H6S33_000281 [Morchella sextelata]KAH0614645.1 hypothetical protein H6S33_000281 [Morchella sextelata]